MQGGNQKFTPMPVERSNYRFRIREPIAGRFGAVDVSLCDLSEKGIQIEHTESLPPGYSAILSYTIPGSERRIDVHGEIRWSVADRSGTKRRFRSGVSVDQSSEGLAASLDLFIRKGMAKLDRGLREPKGTPVAYRAAEPIAFTIADAGTDRIPVGDEHVGGSDLRAIEQARERLSASFDEALKWYNRARYSLAEESVQKAVIGIRHKEDVLAVWEFLGRRIDIATIARAFNRRSY